MSAECINPSTFWCEQEVFILSVKIAQWLARENVLPNATFLLDILAGWRLRDVARYIEDMDAAACDVVEGVEHLSASDGAMLQGKHFLLCAERQLLKVDEALAQDKFEAYATSLEMATRRGTQMMIRSREESTDGNQEREMIHVSPMVLMLMMFEKGHTGDADELFVLASIKLKLYLVSKYVDYLSSQSSKYRRTIGDLYLGKRAQISQILIP